ncbi:MAG: sigma 54-interacting transcriptional regulator [Gammaproteobacteria bacterium]
MENEGMVIAANADDAPVDMVRPKVLVVDSDSGPLQVRLEGAGYAVRTAENGRAALRCLESFDPQLVVVGCDVEGDDGVPLLTVIRELSPTLPVIALSATNSIQDAIEAVKSGVFSFLMKPVDGAMLIEQVAKALRLMAKESVPADRDNWWRSEIITRSRVMEETLREARLIAESEASVLIYGESGTGKELLARAIHRASRRRDKPFIAINCSAIPEPLLESELFGYRKGSFTGAVKDHKGLFHAAHQGTLFLDEIGDMPLALQPKLLRVLEEKQIRPLGATEAVPVDVRVISATHQDLDEKLRNGEFREDLYYRLNVVNLELPSLAERPEDIPLLATHFLLQLSAKNRKNVRGFSPEAMELLLAAAWPGNVRQLYNVVEHVVTLCSTPIVPERFVQRALRDKRKETLSLAEAKKNFEREYLTQLLQITGGNVTQAARLAKRNRTEFYKLLHRHCLDPTLFKLAK